MGGTEISMERTIVIYKSKYGATDRYAAWIGEELDCPVVELENFDKKSIDEYDNIIYGGGVHAGGIRGWEDFKKIIKPYLDSAYYEGLEKTEGVSVTGNFSLGGFLKSYKKKQARSFVEKEMDRQVEYEQIRENYHSTKKVVCFAVGLNVQNFDARAQLRDVNFDKRYLRPITCYYLDGAYDPAKVKGIDEKIMGMMVKMLKNKGLNATADERELLRRVEEGCDLVDRAQIAPIIREFIPDHEF